MTENSALSAGRVPVRHLAHLVAIETTGLPVLPSVEETSAMDELMHSARAGAEHSHTPLGLKATAGQSLVTPRWGTPRGLI